MEKERNTRFLQSNILIEQKQAFSVYEYRIFYQVLRKLYQKEAIIKKKITASRSEEEQKEYKEKLSSYERELTIKELCKDENRTFVIYMSEFLETWNLSNGSAYDCVIAVIQKIMSKTASFEFREKDEAGKLHSKIPAMFQEGGYREGEGLFTLTLTSSIMPYIAALETEFTIMILSEVGKLQTANSMRLYELLLQYRNIGTRSFTISDFCEKMYVSEKYISRRDNLAKRVIEPALSEIEKTNIKATYKYEGRGKKTIVRFDIFENRKLNDNSILAKAKKLVGNEDAQDFVEFLEEKISDRKITNKKAYMSTMLKESEDKLVTEFKEIKKDKLAARLRDENSLLDVYYRKLREEAEEKQAERRLEVFGKSSEIRVVNDKINKLMPYMVTASLNGEANVDGEYYTKDKLDGEIARLSARYDEILAGLGYASDYLEKKFKCEKCSDTGIRNDDGTRCSCREERLKEARKKL